MKIAGHDCGCENRKKIMFEHGGAGVPEAVVLGAIVIVLAVAWKYGNHQ